MTYSSIKPVKGVCIDCTDGKQKYLKAGRCSFHYAKHRATVSATRKGITKPVYSTITSKPKRKKKDAELEAWFDEIALIIAENPYCMECGAPISPEHYRHATAHIFPKADFDSVKTAQWNYVIAGATCGCHNKTHRLDTFSKMKIWPIAVQRFYTFESNIKERHKYLELFKSYIV